MVDLPLLLLALLAVVLVLVQMVQMVQKADRARPALAVVSSSASAALDPREVVDRYAWSIVPHCGPSDLLQESVEVGERALVEWCSETAVLGAKSA